ncbi:TPA: DUF4406 domain-containing protein [Kluyvera ascorbata]|uniref:DUF4406 domain-containing protein n=1 Tax=Kluyvera ascorbata TaxID=51288 RepID=UPI00289EEDD2|nr:DUF4406 domain-containing protein [Kluyvera ascorbata]HED3065059.1 DUF4406 domain-containing protein [Kluyvera ascorbata]
MIVHIAGPMTNRPQFNRPAFFAAAARLRATGNIPLNPAVLPSGLSQADYMSICMAMLQRAEAIYLLDGWKNSDGAVAEYHLAYKLGLKVLTSQGVSTHNKEVSK